MKMTFVVPPDKWIIKWEPVRPAKTTKVITECSTNLIFGSAWLWEEYEQDGETKKGYFFRLHFLSSGTHIDAPRFYKSLEETKAAANKMIAEESNKWLNKFPSK